MFDSRHFLLFLAAAALLAITPGPGIFYVLARSLAGGKREGVLSSLGTLAGGLFHVFAAALGLSAILAASAVAFHTVKYAGAAYLIWLGIRTIRTRNRSEEHTSELQSRLHLVCRLLLEKKKTAYALRLPPRWLQRRSR